MKAFNIICFSMAISGCAVFNGAPNPIIDVNKTVERYSVELERLANNPPKECKDVKSATNQALTALDLRYAEFINDISLEGRTKTTATDFALIGLGLAGTAVGGAGVKTILHAISTGVAGANTSIDKNYFYEKTIPALVSKMNADRKVQQLLIIGRLAKCKEVDYSWFEAVHDLNDYYSAGTLLGAISSISKDAGVKQTDSEKAIEERLLNAVTLTPTTSTPDKESLRQMLQKPGGSEKIKTCWKTVNPELFKPNSKSSCALTLQRVPYPADLINAVECAEDQPKVRECLEKP